MLQSVIVAHCITNVVLYVNSNGLIYPPKPIQLMKRDSVTNDQTSSQAFAFIMLMGLMVFAMTTERTELLHTSMF